MSTPRFDLAGIVELLRRSENDPRVRKFFGPAMSHIARDEYYGSLELKSEGVDVVFQKAPWVVPSEDVADPSELYVAAFHLHRGGHEGSAGYSGQLPNGVALDDLEGDVLRKMGSSPHSRGGGAISKLLGPIPDWFRFAFGNGFLHFQLDAGGRIEMVTLDAGDPTRLGARSLTG